MTRLAEELAAKYWPLVPPKHTGTLTTAMQLRPDPVAVAALEEFGELACKVAGAPRFHDCRCQICEGRREAAEDVRALIRDGLKSKEGQHANTTAD